MKQHALYLTLLAAVVLNPTTANAATFTIDSAQSWLQVYLSVDLPEGTREIEPQTSGSLRAAVVGTIEIDQSLPGFFSADATFELVEQPVSFEPFGAPADWAGLIADFDGPGNDVLLAARGVGSSAYSPDWIPLTAEGYFDPEQVVAAFEYGTLDMQFPGEEPASLPMSLLNLAAANQSTEAGQLRQISPNKIEFRLPVHSRYRSPAIEEIVTGLDGEIVAYLIVPEPPGLLTVATGAIGVLLMGRRIRRSCARHNR